MRGSRLLEVGSQRRGRPSVAGVAALFRLVFAPFLLRWRRGPVLLASLLREFAGAVLGLFGGDQGFENGVVTRPLFAAQLTDASSGATGLGRGRKRRVRQGLAVAARLPQSGFHTGDVDVRSTRRRRGHGERLLCLAMSSSRRIRARNSGLGM